MRVLKVPDTGPKRKLLDAAERLVVEKGFDLVSVRDITGAVKANVAAVNYHFGSREGLMDLVAFRVMNPLNEERVKALAATGKTVPIGEIVAAYVRPLFATADLLEMDIGFFLKLAGRVSVLPDSSLIPSLLAERNSVTDRFLEELSKSGAELIPSAWRFFEAGLAQSLLTTPKSADPSALTNHWIAFATRGLGTESAKPEKKDAQGMLFDL